MKNKQSGEIGWVLSVLAGLTLLLILAWLTVSRPIKGEIWLDSGSVEGFSRLGFGANEDDNWQGFTNSRVAQGLHRQAGSQLIRVWISSQWYRNSTIPLKQTGVWDFTALDKYIESVLASGATPMLCFAHAPAQNQPLSHTNNLGERVIVGHWELPPLSDTAYADYIEGVLRHYIRKYGNIDGWYIEIWNEPGNPEWWQGNPPRYALLFNLVAERVKKITKAKMGGFSGGFFPGSENKELRDFLTNSKPDFVSFHHYGNIIHQRFEPEQRMQDIKPIMHDYFVSARAFVDKYGSPNTEIINSEYSLDTEKLEILSSQFAAAWYASALIWQLKSQSVDYELFYQGTSPSPYSHFGFWSSEMHPWPVHSVKAAFVQSHPRGSTILSVRLSEELDKIVDALATKSSTGTRLTLVNKSPKSITIALNTDFKSIWELPSGKPLRAQNGRIQLTLKGYEVRFFRLE